MTPHEDPSVTKELLDCIHGVDARERLLHRLHSVALVLRGLPQKEVAALFGDAPRSVAYWVTRFKMAGLAGLAEKPRAGRPSRLSDSQMGKVKRFVLAKRKKSEPVNASALATFVKESFAVTLTVRQCWRILGSFNE